MRDAIVTPPGERLLTKKQVLAKLSISAPTLWRIIRKKQFPPAIQISPGRIGWSATVVDQWIKDRLEAA